VYVLLSVDKEQAIRSQAYRVLRYLVTDDIVIKEMVALNMDVFIARYTHHYYYTHTLSSNTLHTLRYYTILYA
jgi:hypothetical protein